MVWILNCILKIFVVVKNTTKYLSRKKPKTLHKVFIDSQFTYYPSWSFKIIAIDLMMNYQIEVIWHQQRHLSFVYNINSEALRSFFHILTKENVISRSDHYCNCLKQIPFIFNSHKVRKVTEPNFWIKSSVESGGPKMV